MRKNFLVTVGCIICFTMFLSINAKAENIIRPPENLKSLIGKLATIENVYGPGTFFCSITGVSEYVASMGKDITLSVSGLNYDGEQISAISYVISVSEPEEWRLLHAGKLVKIRLKSIE